VTVTIEVVSPASGAVVAKVVEADAGAVDAAVTAARHAFAEWSQSAVEDRAGVLERWADLVVAHGEELAASVSREMGMPITLARITQADLPAGVLRRTARNIREFAWTTAHEGYRVHHVAAGVVAAITPWNMPVYQAAAKLGPALGAGCTAVLKPSELAPTGCETFARLGVEAGLPAGVLGVVQGRGPTTGEALVGHEDIDVVSFTGSVAAGSRVGALAGSKLRRVALELGGKSAAIVLDDVDLDEVVPRAVRAAFLNSGQACNAPTRLLVPRATLPRVEQLAAATVAELRIGAPDDPATDLGPLASPPSTSGSAGSCSGRWPPGPGSSRPAPTPTRHRGSRRWCWPRSPRTRRSRSRRCSARCWSSSGTTATRTRWRSRTALHTACRPRCGGMIPNGSPGWPAN